MKNPDHGHVQWRPVCDERGQVKHWICSCGVIIPDPVDPHFEESLDLLIEELARAARELLATPVRPNESSAMTELRRSLQASIDEWDRSIAGKDFMRPKLVRCKRCGRKIPAPRWVIEAKITVFCKNCPTGHPLDTRTKSGPPPWQKS